MHCEAHALVGVKQNTLEVQVLEKRTVRNSAAVVS